MSNESRIFRLKGRHTELVIDCAGRAPVLAYWGDRLQSAEAALSIAALAERQEAPASPHDEAPISLSTEFGAGFAGSAGLQVHREGRAWSTWLEIQDVTADAGSVTIRSRCTGTGIMVVHALSMHPDSDVVTLQTELQNDGSDPLAIERCDAPGFRLPTHLTRVTTLGGRWANEFQTVELETTRGSFVRENRAGRTSHGTFPGLYVASVDASERHGDVLGLHLGWSGNYRVAVETDISGRTCTQFGELFHPGELALAPGEVYRSPTLHGAFSSAGRSSVSRRLHRFVRAELTDERMAGKQKPVHFNTWEAMYFDVSEASLLPLIAAAADVGIERFVLDDGWFRGRHSDRAALGDWFVDAGKFPNGLGPTIERVNEAGMEFGLWVEPEMVNPDSDLYRAHPDWVLQGDPAPRLLFRHQLVLDLSRDDVHDYLFGRLDELLTTYPITYLKWDMNRDISQPGNGEGRASTHAQTLGLYRLLERLRASHPRVEIESCSSGGARADYGVLRYTDRVWTSDSNDALDRLRIQHGFSHFFPPEFMGSHIGPFECHITGRRLSMNLRAGVALFGDMGVEADLLTMSEEDKSTLRDAIRLHKEWRGVLHSGDLHRLDRPDYEVAAGVVSPDKSMAFYFYAVTGTPPFSLPGTLRLAGLDAGRDYTVSRVWPRSVDEFSTSALSTIDGNAFAGDVLMQAGLQLPLMNPESLLVLRLNATG